MSLYCDPGGKSVEVIFYPLKKEPFRYKYPDEDWQEVLDGDTHTIEPVDPGFSGGQCPTKYQVIYQQGVCRRNKFIGWSSKFKTPRIDGPILEIYARDSEGNRINLPTDPCDRIRKQIKILTSQGEIKGTGFFSGTYTGLRIVGIERTDKQPDNCGNPPQKHHFKVFDPFGVLVFERIDEDFPDVKEPTCLQDEAITKRYELARTPSALAIRKHPIAPISPLLVKPECVYVQAVLITDLDAFSNAFEINDGIANFLKSLPIIDEICSDKGCNPPTYEVHCDPDKKCPSETCFACKHDGEVCCFGAPDKDGFHQVIYSYRE